MLREKALVHCEKKDSPGNWIAPPGSNRSGGGGNKAAGASGVEVCIRRLGKLQDVSRVNAEQGLETCDAGADLSVMWGRPTSVSPTSEISSIEPAGVWRRHADIVDQTQQGKPHR